MVIRLEIVEGYLIGKKPNGEIINIGPIMPLIKRRKDPIDGKERWKDGSFLTE